MSSFTQYQTASAHSVPQKLPLRFNGLPTQDYLELIGIDSPVVRRAQKDELTNAAKTFKENEWNSDKEDELRIRILSRAVVGWSFEEDCSFDNVFAFLKEAPQVVESIDLFISNGNNFAKKLKD